MEPLPFRLNYLTKEIIQKAKEELGETEEIKKEGLKKIREFAEKEPGLVYLNDEAHLLAFLRVAKYDIRKATTLLRNYFVFKNNYDYIFEKLTFDGIKKNFENGCLHVMPFRDHEGSIISIIKLGNWNVEDMTFDVFVHALVWSITACVDRQHATQICGAQIIYDGKGIALKHIRNISLSHCYMSGSGLSKAVPLRIRAIHMVNMSPVISVLWNMVKFFLSSKIRKRVHFYADDWPNLHKHINPMILPEEYGGMLKYDDSCVMETIDEYEERYHELNACGYKL